MSDIFYDEQGRPYSFLGGTTRRSYLSPEAMGVRGQRPSDHGFLSTDYNWNTETGDWENGIDWGKVFTLAVAGMGAGAGLSAAGAFGGAGGGAGAGGAGTAALPASIPASALTPEAASGALFGSTTPVGAGGAAGGIRGLLGGGSTIRKLAGLGMGVGSGLMARANQPQLSPELQMLLQEAVGRMTSQRPLYQAVQQGMLAGLPTYAKKGTP